MPLRIASYNIRGGNGLDGLHDYKRINRFLESCHADVVLLQEVDTRPAVRSTEQDIRDLCGQHFPWFIAGKTISGNDGWYGNAIMSRFEIISHEVFDVSMSGREPRNIMEARIRSDEGDLRILNTHKGLNHGERRWQLKRLHSLLTSEEQTPLFVGGDINEWQTSSRAVQELNAVLHPYPLGRTFPTFCPLFHLDRIWCRPRHLIEEARILKTRETRMYSDHYPVLAHLRPLDRLFTENE